jgi:hypothetical protein
MSGLLYKLRGIETWPEAEATVTSTEEVSSGGRSGRTMNVFFSYRTPQGLCDGRLFVDDNSSIYGLDRGETFVIQVNPRNPNQIYCAESKSLSQTIRRGIVIVGVAFAVAVILIQFLGRK